MGEDRGLEVRRTDREEARLVRQRARRLARAGLGFALAGGEILTGAAPFGVAFVAASGHGGEGLSALLGALGGYLLRMTVERGLRYGAAAILAFALATAFWDTRWGKSQHFMPLAAGALVALTGVVTTPGGQFSAEAAAVLTGETALTVVGTYAFRAGFSLWGQGVERPGTGKQKVGAAALALSLAVTLAEAKVFRVASVGKALCALAAVSAGYAAGGGAGAAVGLCGGLAMDLATGQAGVYSVALGLGGLFSALTGKKRSSAAAGFAAAVAAVMLWQWERVMTGNWLWELAMAEGAFFLLKRGWLEQLRLLLGTPGRKVEVSPTAARRLKKTAEAFSAVVSALRGAFPRNLAGDEPEDVIDWVTERVCARCGKKELCWQKDYNDTHDLLNHALEAICREQRVGAESFPQRFRDRCGRFSEFLAETKEQWQGYILRRQMERRVEESRRVVRSQYTALAQTLEEAAEAMARPEAVDTARTRRLERFLAGRELRCGGRAYFDQGGKLRLELAGADVGAFYAQPEAHARLEEVLEMKLAEVSAEEGRVELRQKEPLDITAALSGDTREGESVSGDAGAWFKDESGLCHIILCDGMGSGSLARRDSQVTLEILEKLLLAGVTAENALRTLDQALALRSEGFGGFAALDLMTLDLFSGEGTLYKLGSPASYLKRGGTVVKLEGKALPAGVTLEERRMEKICFRLSPGDCLLLVTDGVVNGGEDEWLKAALSGFDTGSPADFAREVAFHGQSREDDKTALAVRVGCGK